MLDKIYLFFVILATHSINAIGNSTIVKNILNEIIKNASIPLWESSSDNMITNEEIVVFSRNFELKGGLLLLRNITLDIRASVFIFEGVNMTIDLDGQARPSPLFKADVYSSLIIKNSMILINHKATLKFEISIFLIWNSSQLNMASCQVAQADPYSKFSGLLLKFVYAGNNSIINVDTLNIYFKNEPNVIVFTLSQSYGQFSYVTLTTSTILGYFALIDTDYKLSLFNSTIFSVSAMKINFIRAVNTYSFFRNVSIYLTFDLESCSNENFFIGIEGTSQAIFLGVVFIANVGCYSFIKIKVQYSTLIISGLFFQSNRFLNGLEIKADYSNISVYYVNCDGNFPVFSFDALAQGSCLTLITSGIIITDFTCQKSESLNIAGCLSLYIINSGKVLFSKLSVIQNTKQIIHQYRDEFAPISISSDDTVISEVTFLNSVLAYNSLIYEDKMPLRISAAVFIDLPSGWITIYNCSFEWNNSTTSASALYIRASGVLLTKCLFSFNQIISMPNQIFYSTIVSEAGALNIVNSLFKNNTGKNGGCLFFKENLVYSDISIINITAMGNIALYQGGFFMRSSDRGIRIVVKTSYFDWNNGAEYSGCFTFETYYTNKDNSFYILDCYFSNNSAKSSGGVMYTSPISGDVEISLDSCVFLENFLTYEDDESAQGAVIDCWGYPGVVLRTSNCFVALHKRCYFGGALSIVTGKYMDEKSIFIDNYAHLQGGTFFFTTNVEALIYNTIIMKSSADSGGVISGQQNTQITIVNSEIYLSSAVKGSVLLLDQCSNFTILNLTTNDSVAFQVGTVVFLTNGGGLACSINSSNFKNFKGLLYGFVLADIYLSIYSCNFHEGGPVFFLARMFTVEFLQSNISNIFCGLSFQEGCVFRLSQTTNFELTYCQFRNFSGRVQGGIILLEYSIIRIKYCGYFLLNFSDSSALLFRARAAKIEAHLIIVKDYVYNLIYVQDGILSLTDSKFITKQELISSSIVLSDCIRFYSNNISFEEHNYKTPKSSCIYIQQEETLEDILNNNERWNNMILVGEPDILDFTLANSTFANNTGVSGPAVFANNVGKLNLVSNRFINNFAAKEGGAVYINCDDQKKYNCSTTLSSNIFRNNEALEGGAIMWRGLFTPAKLSSNIFQDNRAIYGINFGSFPSILSFLIKYPDGRIMRSDDFIEDFHIIQNVTSGDVAEWTMEVSLYDEMNQTIISEETSISLELVNTTLIFENRSFNSNQCNLNAYLMDCNQKLEELKNSTKSLKEDNDILYIGKNKRILANNRRISKAEGGFIRLENIRILGTPGQMYFIRISSVLIDSSQKDYIKIKKRSIFEFFDETDSKYILLIPVRVRRCFRGELYRSSENVCEACANTRYSFSPFDEDCQICPENAECPGGSLIQLKNGYWRSGENSTILYQCDVILRSCQGGIGDPCAIGYTGIMCEECKQNSSVVTYDKDGFGFCSECYNGLINMLIFMAYFALSLISMGFVITEIVFGKRKERKAVIRIVINTLQNLSYIPVEIANMPLIMVYYYKVIKEIADISLRWVNTGCFYSYFGLIKSRIFNQLITSLVVSLGMLLILLFIWRQRAGKAWRRSGDKLLLTFIILVYFLQPILLRNAFNMLGCIDIEGFLRLRANLEEVCWTETHAIRALFISVPIVFVLMLLFPYMSYYYFWKQMYSKNSSAISSLHFLLVAYKKKFLLWELVTFIRKYALVFCAAVFYKDGNGTAIALVSINLSHLAHVIFKPYSLQSLNNLENLSFLVISVSYYTALLSNNEKVEDENKIFLWLLTFLIHCSFICYSAIIGLPIKQLKKNFFRRIKNRISSRLKSVVMVWAYIFDKLRSKREKKEAKVYSAPELRAFDKKAKLPRTSLGEVLSKKNERKSR